MTPGQSIALEQLQEIAAAPGSPLEIVESGTPEGEDYLTVLISVDCRDILVSVEGMPLRARERLLILVSPNFPFECPSIFSTHTRFMGFPHVYWGQYFCLYQAPDTEWNPSDGMYGFATRIDLFLRKAAAGELDPIGAPMHPPTTPDSKRDDLPLIIPKANAPSFQEGAWFGFATVENVSKGRVDVTGWANLFDSSWPDSPVAAAVLLGKPLSHEFPKTIGGLLQALGDNGVSRNLLVLVVRCALLQTKEESPLIILIGAPMRGIKGDVVPKQHLTAWYVDPEVAQALRRAMPLSNDSEELRVLRTQYEDAYFNVLKGQRVHWCTVLEDRPEIIVRRDLGTPLNWFVGKKVSVWGCGAIGAQLAESVARAGASHLILYDQARVKPGVLVRQPYHDLDIGFPKAEVLRRNLQRIRPDLLVEARVADVTADVLDRADWHDNADIILDATASRAVLTKLELKRKTNFHTVPIASFVLGAQATRGMLIVTGSGHSGGPFDAARSAKLQLLSLDADSPCVADFFPRTPHTAFQPEPGCSEPTFIGSYSDVSALSHTMLNAVTTILTSMHNSEAEARFFGQLGTESQRTTIAYRIGGRLTSEDLQTNFEIRISEAAWVQMQQHVDRSAWKHGKRVETGGILLGERDEILRVIWIDEFSPPPKDSKLTEAEFLCGVDGTAELHNQRDRESYGSVRYLGMWHTHPESLPVPSPKDILAMSLLSDQTGGASAHSLMVIIGTPYQHLALATYAFSRAEIRENLYSRTCSVTFPPCKLKDVSRDRRLKQNGREPRSRRGRRA